MFLFIVETQKTPGEMRSPFSYRSKNEVRQNQKRRSGVNYQGINLIEENFLSLIVFFISAKFFLSFTKHFLKIKYLFFFVYQHVEKYSLVHFDGYPLNFCF